MDSRWWYGVAASGLFWGLFLVVPNSFDYVDRIASETVGAMVGLGVIVTWFLLPAALYLDWRAIRDDVTWDPEIPLWVLTGVFWFLNVSVAVAYVVRRRSAIEGRVPDERWRYVVGGTLVVWLAFFLVAQDAVAAALPPVVVSANQTALFVAWLGLPAATYLDLGHVQAHTDWDATVPLWMIGTGIPLLGFVVGLLYLGFRQRATDRADDSTRSTEGVTAEADDGRRDTSDEGADDRAIDEDGDPDVDLWNDVDPEEAAGDESPPGETKPDADEPSGERGPEADESSDDGQWDDVFEGR